MNNFLEIFFNLAKRKLEINTQLAQKTFPWENYNDWLSHEIYIPGIKNEIDEVIPEIRKENSVYLEDELWDIFWTYINLLYCLEQEWYISKENVFERAFQKYSQRTSGLENGILWDEIKKLQKRKISSRTP